MRDTRQDSTECQSCGGKPVFHVTDATGGGIVEHHVCKEHIADLLASTKSRSLVRRYWRLLVVFFAALVGVLVLNIVGLYLSGQLPTPPAR
jgi:hypothetical protein